MRVSRTWSYNRVAITGTLQRSRLAVPAGLSWRFGPALLALFGSK